MLGDLRCPWRLGMEEGEDTLAMVSYRRLRGLYATSSSPTASAPRCPCPALTPPSRTAASCSRRTAIRKSSRCMLYLPEETELAIRTSASRLLLVGTRADPGQDHPRQPGRGRRHSEKEPARCLRRPGGHAGAGQPSPLPRPQPARHGCSDPRRRRGRTDEPAVKNSPSRLWRQIPPFVTCGDIFPRRGGSRPLRWEPLAWWQSFWLNCKVSGFARGSLSEGAGTA